jgi:hypothetical protein
MVRIPLLPDIELINPQTKEKIGPAKHLDVIENLLLDERMRKGVAELRTQRQIQRAIDKAREEKLEFLDLHPNDFAALKPILENPQGGYTPMGVQLLGYIEATLDAKAVD